MSKPFDAATKRLFEADPIAWLHYAGLSGSRARLIETDLSTIAGDVDKVLRVHARRPYLAHFEFEATYRKRQGERMLRWNSLLHTRHLLPVRSVLVLLRPQADGPAITGAAGYSFRDGPERLDFRYRVVRVWQQSPEEVLRGGLATLPLAPLADIDPVDLPSVLRRMERRIEREAEASDAGILWTATYLLMGLTFDRAMIEQLMKGVRSMKESVTYRAIIEEGKSIGIREGESIGIRKGESIGIRKGESIGIRKGESIGIKKGEVDEARRMVIRLGSRRFGPPDARTRAAIHSIPSLARLERLLERVLEVEDWSALRKTVAPRNGVRRRGAVSR